MTVRPDLLTTAPYLIVPAVLAAVVLWRARRQGATWTQVQASFLAALLGAFITTGGWLVAGYFADEQATVWRIIASEILVAGACGLVAFFGTMPADHQLK